MSKQHKLLAVALLLVLVGGAAFYLLTRPSQGPTDTKNGQASGACANDDDCAAGQACCGALCRPAEVCDEMLDREMPPRPPPGQSGEARKRTLREVSGEPTQADREARVTALADDACQSNKDCATQLMKCDTNVGRCQEPAICWHDADCVGGRKCHKGHCTSKIEGCRTKDCPAGWRCEAETGQCESYHCNSDEECAGKRRCLPTGLCAECVEDSDCPSDKMCYSSHCKPREGACHGDGNCEEGMACDKSVWKCVDPKKCADDNMEDNDKRSQAVEIQPGDHELNLCYRDDDWFKVDVLAGESVLVTTEYPHPKGHLEIRSYDAQGLELSRAGDLELNGYIVMPIEQVEEDQTLFIKVKNSSGTGMPYTLRIQRGYRSFCADDEFEPNDVQEEAKPTHAKLHYTLKLCDGRDDWFYADLDEGQELEVYLRTEFGEVPLMEIYEDGQLERVALDDSLDRPKTLNYKAKTKARHFVRVFPKYLEDSSTYTLMLKR